MVACDEMWTYVKGRKGEKRREAWVWTAVIEDAGGRRGVDLVVGDRSEGTFLQLYDGLPEAERYCTDGYPVYQWLPRDRHEVGKGGAVNWNEGLHSRLRSGLNRLVRDTKGYSKSAEMLAGSIALWLWRRGLI